MMKYTCVNKNLALVLTAPDVVAPCLEQTQSVLTKTQANTFYWQNITDSYSSTQDEFSFHK